MNVPSRSSQAEKLIRSPFRSTRRQAQVRESQVAEFDEVQVARMTDRTRRTAVAKLESELGEATYNCQCGFIFQAPVLTSVPCPHCGNSQAW